MTMFKNDQAIVELQATITVGLFDKATGTLFFCDAEGNPCVSVEIADETLWFPLKALPSLMGIEPKKFHKLLAQFNEAVGFDRQPESFDFLCANVAESRLETRESIAIALEDVAQLCLFLTKKGAQLSSNFCFTFQVFTGFAEILADGSLKNMEADEEQEATLH